MCVYEREPERERERERATRMGAGASAVFKIGLITYSICRDRFTHTL